LATDYSQKMCAGGFFDHRDPDGLQVQDRLQQKYPGLIHCGVGENLFMSDRSSNTPRSREDFNCSLATPDPNARIKVDLFSYYTGLIPLKCVWRKDGTLTLILDFRAGSGEYKLQAGWGEYYYSDLFTFKVL